MMVQLASILKDDDLGFGFGLTRIGRTLVFGYCRV